MPTKTVKLENFANELKEFTDKSIEELRKGVASGVAKSIPDLVKASPVDTGLYAASWDFSVNEEQVILGNFAPHAPIIELGARPFSPPIKPLLEWAKRVLGDSSQPPDYSEPVRELAWATFYKIRAQGIKPRNVLRDMLPKIVENIKQELRRV